VQVLLKKFGQGTSKLKQDYAIATCNIYATCCKKKKEKMIAIATCCQPNKEKNRYPNLRP
jgi:hypothetical protein